MSTRFTLGALLVVAATQIAHSVEAQSATSATPPAEGKAATNSADEAAASEPMLHRSSTPSHVIRSWQDAVRLLHSQNVALRTQIAMVKQAEAQADLALAAMLPNLVAAGGVSRHLLFGEGQRFDALGAHQGSIPHPSMNWTAAVALNVPIFAPKAWYDEVTSRRQVGAALLSEADAERAAMAQAADAIARVVTAERAAEVSRNSLRSALFTLELHRQSSQRGASTVLDVLRAEQEVLLCRSLIVAADEAVQRARELLGAALGSAEGWGVAPELGLDTLAGDMQSKCNRSASTPLRSDLKAAAANVEVAERNVRSSSYAILPTMGAFSTLGYSSNELLQPNGEHVTWAIGGVLAWQLYDGGLRYAAKRYNEASLQFAREHQVEVTNKATVETNQAYRQVEVTEDSLAIATRMRDVAAESARLSAVAFTKGVGTSFDLVDTTRRLRDAELDLAIKGLQVGRAKIAALLSVAPCPP